MLTLFRILVADDHEVVRHGLRALLESQPNWTVCGEASDGREAVATAIEMKPELVVLDIGMPKLNGLEATRQILAALPAAKVLILSLYESEQMIQEVLASGARGYLLKSDASRYLVKAAEALRNGKTFFTPRFGHLIVDGTLRPHSATKTASPSVISLTAREREVVYLLGAGKSTKEVAAALDMAVKTAETHRAHIMHKLNLHSITDLVLYAVRNGIVSAPGPVHEPIGGGNGHCEPSTLATTVQQSGIPQRNAEVPPSTFNLR
jgi:DNA-binding NarL/FixJ family response regulator